MASLFDKIKDAADEHSDKLDGVVDQLADVVDDRTRGKHRDKIDAAAQKAKDFLGEKPGGKWEGEPPSKLSP